MQRQPGIPDGGVRARLGIVAVWASLMLLVSGEPVLAQTAQSRKPASTPGTAASSSAKRATAGNKAGPAASSDGKAGAPGSPFGMLQFSANNGPIQIKADSLKLDYKNNLVEFDGAVHATQSGTSLASKSLKVIYGAKFGDIKQVIALGDVKMMQGGRWATGQRAVLDEQKHTVEMTGQPVIHDGPDSVAGTRIMIYLDSEKSFVDHANAVIFPSSKGKTDHEATD
jgi:lipopolysaccharide export system protein LptA